MRAKIPHVCGTGATVLFDNDDLKETESDKKSKLNVKSHDRLAD